MNEIEKAKSIIKLISDSDINSTFLFGWQIEFIEKLCRKQLNNGWIPVSKRVPTKEEYLKDDGRFIVTDGNRRYQGWFDVYEGHFAKEGRDDVWQEDKCVLAWQPLPSVWKGENNS